MLYAQNRSTDAKLRHNEHGKIIRVRDGKSTPRFQISDPDRDLAGVTLAHGRPGSPGRSAPELKVAGVGEEAGAGA